MSVPVIVRDPLFYLRRMRAARPAPPPVPAVACTSDIWPDPYGPDRVVFGNVPLVHEPQNRPAGGAR